MRQNKKILQSQRKQSKRNEKQSLFSKQHSSILGLSHSMCLPNLRAHLHRFIYETVDIENGNSSKTVSFPKTAKFLKQLWTSCEGKECQFAALHACWAESCSRCGLLVTKSHTHVLHISLSGVVQEIDSPASLHCSFSIGSTTGRVIQAISSAICMNKYKFD